MNKKDLDDIRLGLGHASATTIGSLSQLGKFLELDTILLLADMIETINACLWSQIPISFTNDKDALHLLKRGENILNTRLKMFNETLQRIQEKVKERN
jgi:uncharacterized Rmd1/YagE family protein